MPTVGEIYDPIITAAVQNDPVGHELLREAGHQIFLQAPDQCSSLEDGIRIARHNLNYYCQYCSPSTCDQVKEFYELDPQPRTLLF